MSRRSRLFPLRASTEATAARKKCLIGWQKHRADPNSQLGGGGLVRTEEQGYRRQKVNDGSTMVSRANSDMLQNDSQG